ncbi:MAG: ribonuclease HI [Phycisphaerales bacterium]
MKPRKPTSPPATDAAPPAPGPAGAAPRVELHTDGACSGNPGPGGWAFILKHPATGKVKEASGSEPATTNNRMELTAAIRGFSALTRPSIVEFHSDSEYVLKGLREWLKGWKAKGWRNAAKQPVKNSDLWKTLDELTAGHTVNYHWVRGHSGHPENERCDFLAVAAIEALVGHRVTQPGR